MTARTALVTGGARGIGAAVAARLIRDGFAVVIADRVAPRVGLARFVETDVGDEGAGGRLVDDVRAREGRLDALICNAGFMIRKPIAELTLAEWSAVIATNLTSTFLLVRAAEALLAQSRGAVVTIASTRAAMSEKNTESYSASKGGLVALTHALAISLGPAIRVNCICPGWINTVDGVLDPAEHAQHPVGRVGRPDDVAGLVSFLVGPEAGFITGAEFTIDGGMTRKMIYS